MPALPPPHRGVRALSLLHAPQCVRRARAQRRRVRAQRLGVCRQQRGICQLQRARVVALRRARGLGGGGERRSVFGAECCTEAKSQAQTLAKPQGPTRVKPGSNRGQNLPTCRSRNCASAAATPGWPGSARNARASSSDAEDRPWGFKRVGFNKRWGVGRCRVSTLPQGRSATPRAPPKLLAACCARPPAAAAPLPPARPPPPRPSRPPARAPAARWRC
jgi:hypothetical protein